MPRATNRLTPLSFKCPKCAALEGVQCSRAAAYAGQPHNSRVRLAEKKNA